MGIDVLLGLITLAALVYWGLWEDFLKPLLLGSGRPKSVKNKPDAYRPRLRSRVRTRSNVTNAGSAHQNDEQEGSNVQPNVQLATAAGGQLQQLQLTHKELTQLAAAIALRTNGATVEEALRQAFDVKKGGSQAYKRAKELFDAATAPPR